MTCVELNREAVSAEIIDDEVVIVHFGTGNYYSLRGAAVALWSALIAGVAVETICECLPDPAAHARVDEFLGRLKLEEVLRARSPDSAPEAAVGDFDWATLIAGDPALENLQIERFGDMQMLLLSDPIHEVDEAGWPTLPED